jgi:hypothetical protein
VSFLRGEHQDGWLTPILLEIRAVISSEVASLLEVPVLSQSHSGDTTSLLLLRWEWGDQRPHEQCVTVTSLDDPCLVVGISCSMSHGKITASQGLAGAPSYIPDSTPERECVHSEGLGVRINSLWKLPPALSWGLENRVFKQTNKHRMVCSGRPLHYLRLR